MLLQSTELFSSWILAETLKEIFLKLALQLVPQQAMFLFTVKKFLKGKKERKRKKKKEELQYR